MASAYLVTTKKLNQLYTMRKIEFTYRFFVGTVLLIASYPILVLTYSFIGVFTVFGIAGLLVESLRAILGDVRKKELKDLLLFIFLPALIPFHFWYRYVFYLEIPNIE